MHEGFAEPTFKDRVTKEVTFMCEYIKDMPALVALLMHYFCSGCGAENRFFNKEVLGMELVDSSASVGFFVFLVCLFFKGELDNLEVHCGLGVGERFNPVHISS